MYLNISCDNDLSGNNDDEDDEDDDADDTINKTIDGRTL